MPLAIDCSSILSKHCQQALPAGNASRQCQQASPAGIASRHCQQARTRIHEHAFSEPEPPNTPEHVFRPVRRTRDQRTHVQRTRTRTHPNLRSGHAKICMYMCIYIYIYIYLSLRLRNVSQQRSQCPRLRPLLANLGIYQREMQSEGGAVDGGSII